MNDITLELESKKTLISVLLILLWNSLRGPDNYLRFFMLHFFMTDFLFFYNVMTKDRVFHHLLSIVMIVLYWNHEDTKHLILTEVSTPFLIFFQHGIGTTLNKILFVITFFYFRIYQLGGLLMKRRFEIHHLEVWLFFLLYVLNCWWAEKIIRKLVPLRLKQMLLTLPPYTLCTVLSSVSSKNHLLVNFGYISLPIASYCWHQYRTFWAYILDLCCFHFISFVTSFYHVPSPMVWLSMPFHIADILLYQFHHQMWLMLSIGYDVLSVFFYYKKDFIWLLGWVLVILFLTKQTFGHGSTQPILHILIGCLFKIL